MDFLRALFAAISGACGLATQRGAQRNAPPMQARAAAATDAQQADTAAKAVASALHDPAALDQLRKAAAE